MKTLYILAFLLLSSIFLYAQVPVKADTIKPAKGNVDKQLEKIKERKIDLHSDSTGGNQPKKSVLIDSTKQNKYGDLLDDDPEYNKKYPFWIPASETVGAIVLTWSIDRYILDGDYARIGITSWKNNIKNGWEWDMDRFGVNFIGHPYSGTLSFNAARSNGYKYFPSFGFAVGGSLIWEYFAENTRPSYNDIINTPVNGAFLGEVLYRLSSNVLDDRTRGAERFFRELSAGLINPMRGFNRLIQGKSFRKTNKEVYEKEPLNISIFAGIRRVDSETGGFLGNASNNAMLNIQFDYGNPFEVRKRKPFDFFKLRADANFGVGRKIADNIMGSAILFGKNTHVGKMAILVGGFQYYDYWDNKSFELGTIGFGAGAISKLEISKSINLYSRVHLAVVPFAGNSTRFGPDTSELRDYNFGYGLQGKFESAINFGEHATVAFRYYNYVIRTQVGAPGDNYIHILKPRVTVRLYKGLSIGFENYTYINNRNLLDLAPIHSVRTEQKIFLLLYLEDSQRKGHYD